MWGAVLVKLITAYWTNISQFLILNKKSFWVNFMQKVATNQNWHSQFWPLGPEHGPKYVFEIFIFILGLSINF